MARSRVLVVYYSWSGATRRVAQDLAQRLDADLEEIVELKPRKGLSGYLQAVREVRKARPAEVAPARQDPARYAVVAIGGPVWAWSVSSPVRAYLAANKARLGRVGFFCTMGGTGDRRALRQMQEVLGRAPVAVMSAKAGAVARRSYGDSLDEFAQAIRPRARAALVRARPKRRLARGAPASAPSPAP